MSTTTEKKREVSVAPFAIEARTPRNQDIMIQSIGQMRLRGAVSASVQAFDRTWEDEDQEDAEMPTRPVSAKLIEGVGELPGMQLYVNPATCEWKTADPLYKKEKALKKLQKALSNALGVAAVDQRLEGMKPRSGKLGQDEMKTLCRELLCFIEAGDAKVVKGMAPEREEIDELPGDYLLNWSQKDKWRQPRYEKDYENWADRVGQLEGKT
jgi:hypothetical protein